MYYHQLTTVSAPKHVFELYFASLIAANIAQCKVIKTDKN